MTCPDCERAKTTLCDDCARVYAEYLREMDEEPIT